MVDLVSVVIKMMPMNEGELPPTMGHFGHAAFFAIIDAVDPDMANNLHQLQMKPFTVSPLQGKFRRERSGNLGLFHGWEYWIRLTILDKGLYDALSEFVFRRDDLTLRLGQVHFSINSFISSGADPWSGYASYEDLMNPPSLSKRFSFEFQTPTAFRVRDELDTYNQVLPLPHLCFGSWLNRWNSFSSIPIDGSDIEPEFRKLIVTRHDIRTQMLNYVRGERSGSSQVGFIGRVTFEAKWDVPERSLRLLNTLANFAFYSGTGYKTTMGMGQTRRR